MKTDSLEPKEFLKKTVAKTKGDDEGNDKP